MTKTEKTRPSPVRVGVVLAGGEARRMGSDKRLLRLGGETLLERNLRFLRELFPTIALSVRDASQAPHDLAADVVLVPDEVPGSPLAGLASILRRFDEPVFALAADIAFPEREAVERVLAAFSGVDVALPVAEEHLEPLYAVYGPGCLPQIDRLLAAGAHSILDLYPEVRTATVPFDSVRPFFNVNTPADWDEARRRLAAASEGEREARPARRAAGPAVLAVVGRSGSGKTTLIERLISEFTRRGLRVAAIKQVAEFDIDKPGKDSWRHSRAGAQAYSVASASRLAFVAELQESLSLRDIVERFFSDYDVVIIEGYRKEAPHAIEVFRRGAGHDTPLCTPAEVLAMVTDADLSHEHRFGLDETERLARFLLPRLGILASER